MFPSMIKAMEKVTLEKFSFYKPGGKAFITFAEFPVDSYIAPHVHQKPVCNYIVKGKLEVCLGDNPASYYKVQDWFEIQPGVPHSIRSIEHTELIEVWPDGIDEE